MIKLWLVNKKLQKKKKQIPGSKPSLRPLSYTFRHFPAIGGLPAWAAIGGRGRREEGGNVNGGRLIQTVRCKATLISTLIM